MGDSRYLIGRSSAGKSTLLEIVTRTTEPTPKFLRYATVDEVAKWAGAFEDAEVKE